MSLFQCENCGCAENTAVSYQGFQHIDMFDWSGCEKNQGKALCIVCGPKRLKDGTPTGAGSWHGAFSRIFLPLGCFSTNRQGNLQHKSTGDTDYRKYALEPPKERI